MHSPTDVDVRKPRPHRQQVASYCTLFWREKKNGLLLHVSKVNRFNFNDM